ncbi:hypothetical protein LG315_10210 [Microbacterium marinum]|uniref:hypothetical protein n=1 Tax=Microbacterium marinum TaxID=421115 RepID=UPI00384D87AD
MPDLSPHMAAVPPSGIRRLFEAALELEDVIFLAVGEPDVAVAPHIAEAAVAAWEADLTDYTANSGIPCGMRSRIASRLRTAPRSIPPGSGSRSGRRRRCTRPSD